MESENWARVKQIVNECLDLDAAKRKDHIVEACGGETLLMGEVESLLASYAEAGDFLETSALEEEQEKAQKGRRIGNYQIRETIAQGGMGAVYKAVRADDQYHKEVAIKLIRTGFDSDFLVRRFKAERQILANLDHPNIARLLDGGATEEGQPYLVIEYVQGQPIDEYCDSRKLSTVERLQLFRLVCAAVQFAHQNLVIHRDLKPGNILVTTDGVPKLLDFGIAKIMDPPGTTGAGEATATIARMMTPEYASPEQLRGSAFSTSTDIYSLGVVLYRLLTGHWPYRTASRTLPEIAKAVCEEEPEKPSTAIGRREESTEPGTRAASTTPETVSSLRNERPEKLRSRLAGDLDNILLKALRKEPERRYVSVDQFSEDIRRYLTGLPVIARKDTLAYRTSKFVNRNKAGVAASVLVFLALIGGILATVREARIAREQAEIARAARAKAEQRFNDVRKLANSLIFEIHDSIQKLPAALETRKLLLTRALEYLDSLSKDSSGDSSLQRELGTAYQRIGLLQGNVNDANLGNAEAALSSFRKAIANWEAAARANPSNVIDQLNVAYGHRILSVMYSRAGQPGAREQVDQAMAITGRLLKTDGANPKVRNERALEYGALAGFQDQTGALESLRQELALKEGLLKSNPDYPNLRPGIANVRVRVGDELAQLGSRQEGLQFNQSGLELYETLAADRTDARSTRELAITLKGRGNILMADGRNAEALQCFHRALDILEPMAKAEPDNVLLRSDVREIWYDTGRALVSAGKSAEGLALFERAIQQWERDPNHSSKDIREALAFNLLWKGEALLRMGNPTAALASDREGIAEFEAAAGKAAPTSVELAVSHIKTGAALVKMGKRPEAGTEYRKAVAILEPLTAAQPPDLPALYAAADAYFGMGELSKTEAERSAAAPDQQRTRWMEARDWYRKSAEAWRRIPNPAVIAANGFACGNPKDVARMISICDAALQEPGNR